MLAGICWNTHIDANGLMISIPVKTQQSHGEETEPSAANKITVKSTLSLNLHTGSVVWSMKCTLVFYTCKTNYKKTLKHRRLKICTTTFLKYNALICETVLNEIF
jgi:hypothetical protein